MRQCMDIANVQARIKRIEGQLRAISDMVEKDIPCEDILIQPVLGALVHNVGSVVVILHSSLLLKWKERKNGIGGNAAFKA